MYNFNLDTVDLRIWDEFSNPTETDKSIRLFHKGYNDLTLFVTESDQVYLAAKDGHRKLDRLSGRNINKLASFYDFIVAGADRSELILIAAAQTDVDFTPLTNEYTRIETHDSPCYFYSLTPKNPDQWLTLVGCGVEYILLRDESRKSLISLGIDLRDGRFFLQSYAVTYGSSTGDAPPLEKWSCGHSFGGAVGLDGSAYFLGRRMKWLTGKDNSDFEIHKTSILPSPANSVACTSEAAAFLLVGGEILIVGGLLRSETISLKRLALPPASQLISSFDFFAVSTAASIIIFTDDSEIYAVLEGQTNLLNAFEGTYTPPMCSTNTLLPFTLRPPVKKSESDPPSLTSFIDALYDNEHLSDITLILGDGEIHAHKMILSMKSKYFDKLFRSDDWINKSVNSSSNTLDVTNYCSTTYRAYVRFIYQGQVETSELSYKQLFGLYKITVDNGENFKSDIAAILADSVTLENACEIFQFAVNFNLEELEDRCLQVARIHKLDLLISQGYLSLTFDLRKRLAEALLK